MLTVLQRGLPRSHTASSFAVCLSNCSRGWWQGKKSFSVYLPHHITCLGAVNIRRARSIAGLGVGMANGEIRIYNEKALVGIFLGGLAGAERRRSGNRK